MAAPTIIYLSTGKVGTNGTDKSVPYDHEFLCRPYSDMRNRQACSLRATGGRSGELIAFLFNPSAAKQPAPLAWEPMWCGAEFNTALMCGGSFPVSSVTSTPGGAGVFSISEGDDFIIQRVGALEEKQDERLHAQHDAELPEARQKQGAERRAEHERDHRRVED